MTRPPGPFFFLLRIPGTIAVVKTMSYLQNFSINLNETFTHYRQEDYEHFGI